MIRILRESYTLDRIPAGIHAAQAASLQRKPADVPAHERRHTGEHARAHESRRAGGPAVLCAGSQTIHALPECGPVSTPWGASISLADEILDGYQRRVGNRTNVFIYGGGIIAAGYRAKTNLH